MNPTAGTRAAPGVLGELPHPFPRRARHGYNCRRIRPQSEVTVEQIPSQGPAHLVVAAVRVLTHQTGRPPAIEELATMLGWSKELAGHLVRALESQKIVHTIRSPFDIRVEVAEHQRIETLPVEDRGPGLQDEVEKFHEQFKKKQEALQNLFESGEFEAKKKQRLANLEQELRDFKSPRRPDPFAKPPDEER